MRKNTEKNTGNVSEALKKRFRLTAILSILAVPLADSLLLSPLCGMILANAGSGTFYEIVSTLSEALVTAAFLVAASLVIFALYGDFSSGTGTKVLLFEGLSFIFLVVLLKPPVVWLFAALGEVFPDCPLALSNYTLDYVHEYAVIGWTAVSCFMNVIMLFAVMTVASAAAFFMKKKKISVKYSCALLVLLYFATQMIFCVTDLADTLTVYGSPSSLSEYAFLIMPFVYKICCSAFGAFAVWYAHDYIFGKDE